MDRTSILVVDDSATIRLILREALGEDEFNVAFARDGREALEWTINNPPADLVITDLHMPHLDGIDLVGRLRARADYAHKPIFVLTRGADGNEKERIRDAGATAWIVKPFDKDKLVNAVRKTVALPELAQRAHRVPKPAPADAMRRSATVTYI